jgi:hypothetical protein
MTIEHLGKVKTTTTKDTAVMLGVPTTTARRTLEDLAAHGIVRRIPGEQPGEPDEWTLAGKVAVPEKSL